MPRKRSGSSTKKTPRKTVDIEDDEPLIADDEEEKQLIKSIERRKSLEQQSSQSPQNKKAKTPSPKSKQKEVESDKEDEEEEPPSAKKRKQSKEVVTTPKKTSPSSTIVGTPGGLFSKLLRDASQLPQFSPLKIDQQKDPEISSKDAKKFNPDTSGSSLDISDDGMTVTATKDRLSIAKAYKPLDRSKEVAYFEVKFSHGKKLSVGLATVNSSTNQLLGSQPDTIGYHSNGGKNAGTRETTPYALEFSEGDTIGCGMISKSGQIFFTKNGEFLGVAAVVRASSSYALYPSIGLEEKSTSVTLNYGYQKFLFNLKKKHFKQFSIKGNNSNPFTGLFVDKIPLPLNGVTGTINIVNFMAEVTVCQEYFNYRSHAVDGLFIAPIDDDTTITSFKVTTSENELQAIVVSGTEEDSEVTIKGDVSRTLQAFIENIPPMHAIKITLTYMQILTFELNELIFTLPSTFYPHYASSFTNEVYDLDAVNLTYNKTGVDIKVNLWAASPIRHIRTSMGTERVFQREEGVFRLADSIVKNTFVNDYELRLGLYETHNSQAVLENDSKHKSMYLMIGFCPFMPFVSKGAGEEYIVAIDNSDEKLVAVANTVLPVILKSLPEDCKFNIVTNKPLFKSSKAFTDENVEEALSKEIALSKKFEINKTIEDILTSDSETETLKNILLIMSDTSDLQVETIELVDDVCKSRTQRIFPIAIGDKIDKTFIYTLAKAGRGYPSFVNNNDLLLVNTIRQLDRSLRPSFYDLDVEYTDSDMEVTKQIPEDTPTAFHGDCTFLFHEISQQPKHNIYLKGDLYKGKVYSNNSSDTFKSLTEIGSEIEVKTHGKLVHKFAQFYHLRKLYESNNIKEASLLSTKYDIPVAGISHFKENGQSKTKKRRDHMSMRIFVVPGTSAVPKQDSDRIDRYHKIISLQKVDGSWDFTSELIDTMSIDLKKAKKYETVQCKVTEDKELGEDEDADVINEKLWATSLATSFMFDYVRFKADETRIISQKARNYIANYVGKKAVGACLQESRDYLQKHSKLSLS